MIPPATLECGLLKIDLVQRRVRLYENIKPTPQEFSLLYVLAQAGGVPLSRSDLCGASPILMIPRTMTSRTLSAEKNRNRPATAEPDSNCAQCRLPTKSGVVE